MLKGIGDVLKFLAWGLFFSVFFIYACTERAIVSLGESAVSASQVNVSPTFQTKDYGSMVDIDTDATISSQHALKDFTATLHLYDCATQDTPVAQCKDLGSQYHDFDGDIKAGQRQAVTWVFNFYNVPDRMGVLVPKLEITDARG